MIKLFVILLSLPKTVWFNLRCFPLHQALRLPVFVIYSCDIGKLKGKIILPRTIRIAMIRIGFHSVPALNSKDTTRISVEKGGVLEFEGSAHIGKGSKIYVCKNGRLLLGDNFAISASSTILCYKHISFGSDIQFSWDCLVMDSDTHFIFGKDGEVVNVNKDIIFGNHIWIGCRCMILKGSIIPDDCVIGGGTIIMGGRNSYYKPMTIIAGTPSSSVKEIGGWHI